MRLKLAKVADRLHRQHGVALTCNESPIDAIAELCHSRESGARNVDMFLNQRILPPVSRELLARMASGGAPAKIALSSSADGNLTIDFIDRDEAARAAAPAPAVA